MQCLQIRVWAQLSAHDAPDLFPGICSVEFLHKSDFCGCLVDPLDLPVTMNAWAAVMPQLSKTSCPQRDLWPAMSEQEAKWNLGKRAWGWGMTRERSVKHHLGIHIFSSSPLKLASYQVKWHLNAEQAAETRGRNWIFVPIEPLFKTTFSCLRLNGGSMATLSIVISFLILILCAFLKYNFILKEAAGWWALSQSGGSRCDQLIESRAQSSWAGSLRVAGDAAFEKHTSKVVETASNLTEKRRPLWV